MSMSDLVLIAGLLLTNLFWFVVYILHQQKAETRDYKIQALLLENSTFLIHTNTHLAKISSNTHVLIGMFRQYWEEQDKK